MSADRPLYQACPPALAPVSQGASIYTGMLTRPGSLGVDTRPWTQRSPVRGGLSGRVRWAVHGAAG